MKCCLHWVSPLIQFHVLGRLVDHDSRAHWWELVLHQPIPALESIPHFLHGTVAQMALGGGCSSHSALFAIHDKEGFNFVPHQTYCGEEQFCLPPVIRNKRREIFLRQSGFFTRHESKIQVTFYDCELQRKQEMWDLTTSCFSIYLYLLQKEQDLCCYYCKL